MCVCVRIYKCISVVELRVCFQLPVSLPRGLLSVVCFEDEFNQYVLVQHQCVLGVSGGISHFAWLNFYFSVFFKAANTN